MNRRAGTASDSRPRDKAIELEPDDNPYRKRQIDALEMINERMSALRKATGIKDGGFPSTSDSAAYTRIASWLATWRDETGDAIARCVGPAESEDFLGHYIETGEIVAGVLDYVDLAMDYLASLTSGVQNNPAYYFEAATGAAAAEPPSPGRQAPSGKVVYIMHGTDETNALRLHKMINDWGVDVQFLIDDPSGASTLVQMMEASAGRASFVFILLTLDDEVTDPRGRKYMQPRPNPLIELGYYLGELGQEKVAILCREEVLEFIPTNLGGIKAGTFIRSVEELTGFIQKELAAVGLGPLAKSV